MNLNSFSGLDSRQFAILSCAFQKAQFERAVSAYTAVRNPTVIRSADVIGWTEHLLNRLGRTTFRYSRDDIIAFCFFFTSQSELADDVVIVRLSGNFYDGRSAPEEQDLEAIHKYYNETFRLLEDILLRIP